MDELLDKARRVSEDAEIFSLCQWDEPVNFEANRLKLVQRRESAGVTLRLIKEGRTGITSTTNMENANRLIEDALEMTSFGPTGDIQLPNHSNFNPVEVYDPEVEKLSVEEMIHIGQSLVDRVREGYINLSCDARVNRSVTTLTILNTRGGRATYTKSTFSVMCHGTLVDGTDMLFVSDMAASCRPIKDISELVEAIRLQLYQSRDIVGAPTADSDVTVVFTPKGFTGALLSPLLTGFNGKMVIQKASPIGEKIGRSLVDEQFSLRDEPMTPFATGSRMCDDEGVPTRVVPLIEGGVVRNFLYDLQSASRAGVESTGSAHRGIGNLPEPGVSVVKVSEGVIPYKDMVRGIRRGLVVESLLGAGQSNILGGDFNANVLLGYGIENGEIIGRVKDTVISGNVYRALRNIQAIEDTAHWVGGAVKTPAVAACGISVSTG